MTGMDPQSGVSLSSESCDKAPLSEARPQGEDRLVKGMEAAELTAGNGNFISKIIGYIFFLRK